MVLFVRIVKIRSVPQACRLKPSPIGISVEDAPPSTPTIRVRLLQ